MQRRSVPKPRSFNCPKCAGPISLRYPERAMSVVCPNCRSILDTSTPQVRLLQEYASRISVTPTIPLGSRGKLRGVESEIVGMMRRGGSSGGYRFFWDEYLLYNPYLGYRFLAETKYGWQLTTMTNLIPQPPWDCYGGVAHDQRKYFFSEAYAAFVQFVVGEFYWRVQVGEKALCYDFKLGSDFVMAESMEDEYIWSVGANLPAAEVWRTFQLKGTPPTYVSEEEDEAEDSATGGGGAAAAASSFARAVVILGVIALIILVLSLDECGGASSSGGAFFGGK